jgi:hypothetical protein
VLAIRIKQPGLPRKILIRVRFSGLLGARSSQTDLVPLRRAPE